jgi:predicted DNA-binding transcriptional regulator YafY
VASELHSGESSRTGGQRTKNARAGGDRSRTLIRIKRLLRLAGRLDRPPTFSNESLHETLGISRRTLYRDLALLKEAGLPVAFDRVHGRYASEAHSANVRHVFTAREMAAMLTYLRSRKPPRKGSSYALHLHDCMFKLGSLFKKECSDRDAVEASVAEFLQQAL